MGGRSESSGGDAVTPGGFEYDPNKSASNKAKHGVDFDEAQIMWRDPRGLNVRTNYEPEERWALLATMGGRVWLAVWTPRGLNTRIVFVRRAAREEAAQYHAHNESR
ncbi:MAG: BrnT family toxin [Propionibacteriaceae bacterium]|jgi:uncharacterized DUF497 family protein|nr:BrnT family toxin [Propionibacteriaceae bacterium]